jgi:dTDP-4-dehydrorhamnose reductase
LRILLTGRNGQVGWELERLLPALGEVIATDRATLDLGDADAIRRRVREVRPDVIVNAAAYTAVDQAESERDTAMRINAAAPGIFAEESKAIEALLVHYSTDYVFDGAKSDPYIETDEPRPLSTYGHSKFEGEKRIRAAGCAHVILRTSWVYAARGRNFLLTMLRLAREGRPLRVVNDQFGAPTWSRDIAEATVHLLPKLGADTRATYHLTAAGKTTWYEFARRIFELRGLVASVDAIRTEEYPTAAARPRNSVLDCRKVERDFGVSIPRWERGLGLALADVR